MKDKCRTKLHKAVVFDLNKALEKLHDEIKIVCDKRKCVIIVPVEDLKKSA